MAGFLAGTDNRQQRLNFLSGFFTLLPSPRWLEVLKKCLQEEAAAPSWR